MLSQDIIRSLLDRMHLPHLSILQSKKVIVRRCRQKYFSGLSLGWVTVIHLKQKCLLADKCVKWETIDANASAVRLPEIKVKTAVDWLVDNA